VSIRWRSWIAAVDTVQLKWTRVGVGASIASGSVQPRLTGKRGMKTTVNGEDKTKSKQGRSLSLTFPLCPHLSWRLVHIWQAECYVLA
jgi:hypothetical protein